MTIENQVGRLNHAVEDLAAGVDSLDSGRLLDRLGGWSPRDIVAHLVGWNRHVIEGSRQIRRGELPFYDLDPGQDYAEVNAALVRDYPSSEPGELLDELRASAGELADFLRSLDPEDWSRDFGVRNRDALVTIENTIEELIADYDHHRVQIEIWAASAPA